MYSTNLITTCEGYEALSALGKEPEGPLKAHEIHCLHSFCNRMTKEGCHLDDMNGFYIGYSIRQIGKEFDLLKFTADSILNIELKTELNPDGKEEKILRQMHTNHYYLNAISGSIIIITYVEQDGFYLYMPDTDSMKQVYEKDVASLLQNTHADPSFDPDQKFVPSTFLISPYNAPEKFMQDAYFLTTAQNAIKKEIIDTFQTDTYRLFTLQAATGTGKTLLLYDLAKELMNHGKKIRILHTQKLNPGQQKLITIYHWNICSIVDATIPSLFQNIQFLLIDEAHLLTVPQFQQILDQSKERQIPVLFSYDPKQAQFHTDVFDITDTISKQEPSIPLMQYKLTSKIRTNKEMASFVERMLHPVNNYPSGPFNNITIEYLNQEGLLQDYCRTLSADQYVIIDINQISLQDLTGLEYKKAALIIDQNCYYAQDELYSKNHKEEVLYEVITRVLDELKIIVVQNPDLYQHLVQLKSQE